MPFALRTVTRNHLLAVGLAALAAFTVFAWRGDGQELPSGAGQAATAQAKPTPPPIKVITITVTPSGFSPAKVTVPEGLYLVDVNNRSGLPELGLQLDSLNAKKLKEVKPVKDRQGQVLKLQDWRGLFNLNHGTYTVRAGSRPGWTLEIKVTPK